jgi:hypothetical protein
MDGTLAWNEAVLSEEGRQARGAALDRGHVHPRPYGGRAALSFPTVRSEGGLLPPDLLARVAAADAALAAMSPADYGLPRSMRLGEAAARAWGACKAYWAAFSAAVAYAPAEDSGVTRSREQWLLPLFEALEYGRLPFHGAAELVDGRAYAISHRAGKAEDAPPIHLVSYRQDLDQSPARSEGSRRISPHGLLQEYLNGTPHLWGIVSNGYTLRLLHDNRSLSRPTYVEFDLQAMFEGSQYADFVLLYLLLHRSRLPQGVTDAETCPLSRWRDTARQEGSRALDRLRGGVEMALKLLGRGFLEHPANEVLREALRGGELDVQDYYRELLRLVYRLLFLLVVEERSLLFEDAVGARERAIYDRYYSLSRLRELADGRRPYADRHDDLWRGMRLSFEALRDGCPELSLKPLNGGLFGASSCPHLDRAHLRNTALLDAIHGLSRLRTGKVLQRVNYRDMNVEELGSVYEALLDYHPLIRVSDNAVSFDLGAGSERKTTGSYYTPESLVDELIKSALEPVIADRLRSAAALTRIGHGGTPQSEAPAREALLGIRVCDPACGSGHFLLAAARRLARELARIDSGEREPSVRDLERAKREVIRHCIYGVDLNLLAVDLCKVALWIEGHVPGTPLTFLDHRIKCGNSLVGTTPQLLEAGIPDAAFAPVTGDDKAISKTVTKRNRLDSSQARGQHSFNFSPPADAVTDADVRQAAQIGAMEEDTAEASRRKARRFAEFEGLMAAKRLVADTWAAPYFWTLREGEPLPPTQSNLQAMREGGDHLTLFTALTPAQRARIEELVKANHIFHWHLEFPEVFGEDGDGGFDCVLGNPPWERIKLQEEEYFAVRNPEIAGAPNKAARQRLIDALSVRRLGESEKEYERKTRLAQEFATAKHAAEAQSKFSRTSGRYPLTGVGDVNTYALFAEHFRDIVGKRGRAGLICPTGIATDDSTKRFFGDLSSTSTLASLFDFENREGLFPAVDSRMKFCLLTMAGAPTPAGDFAFFCTDTTQLSNTERRFELSSQDIAQLNPNTRTCPVFRTRADAELTKAIYGRVPVLVNETTGENPWGVSFLRMYDMATDSGLFQSAPAPGMTSLYEAKMLHQFDHRWATYDGNGTRDLTAAEKADPRCTVTPRYWVPRAEVEARLAQRWDRGWLLGWRDICRSTDVRTVIASAFPRVGVGDKFLLILPTFGDRGHTACLLGNLNAMTLDYCARQKLGGTSLKYFTMKQLPILPPDCYTAADLDFIIPRVLELVYSAWDMQPFARDLGYDGPPFAWDEVRRAHLRAELDAYYARLYGLTRKQLRYILDPHDLTDRELSYILDPTEDPPNAPRTTDFPGETFRVLKDRELKQYGEYRTKRLVLAAWDALWNCYSLHAQADR